MEAVFLLCYDHGDPDASVEAASPRRSRVSLRPATVSSITLISFDEVHFGKFASYYLQRTYYFDVHPPLGKLLIAAWGYCVGYDGHFLFENIGDDYVKHKVPYILLRLLPALCGSFIVPVCFSTLKEMGVSIAGCLFCAVLLIFGMSLSNAHSSEFPR